MSREEARQILELPVSADLSMIRQQYRRLAARYHPDRFLAPDERAAATERFQVIAEAFSLLRADARQAKRAARRGPAPGKSSQGSVPYTRPSARWTQTVAEATYADRASRVNGGTTTRHAGTGRADTAVRPIVESAAITLLLPILAPALVARRCSEYLVALIGGAGFPDVIANLIGTVGGHVVPGFVGLEIGRLAVTDPQTRGMLAIVYGAWWVASGALALTLER